MSTKLIAYDKNAPGADYGPLIAAIKELGAWWHHLDSCWLVKSGLSCSQIRDLLIPYLEDGDKLLVVNVTGRARAWHGFSERGRNWIKTTWD